MSHDPRFPEGFEFYPEHPSDEITERIKTTPSPILKQDAPFDVKVLCDEFKQDMDAFLKTYGNKRFEVTGTAICVELDLHNLPTVQLSDEAGGQCYGHCIFPVADADYVMETVSVGDKVVIRSNYLVMSNVFGVVMKFSELVD